MSESSGRSPSLQTLPPLLTTQEAPQYIELASDSSYSAEPSSSSKEPEPKLIIPQPLTSGDIAALTDLPTPTVRYCSPSRNENLPNPGGAQLNPADAPQDNQDSPPQRPQPATRSRNSPLPSPLPSEATSGASRSEMGGHDNDAEDDNDESRILGGMTMAWEGTTAQGVRVFRRDTWAAGHRWRRHVRVIEGPTAEMEFGMGRQGTW